MAKGFWDVWDSAVAREHTVAGYLGDASLAFAVNAARTKHESLERQRAFERAWCCEVAELVSLSPDDVHHVLVAARYDRAVTLRRLDLDMGILFPRHLYPSN